VALVALVARGRALVALVARGRALVALVALVARGRALVALVALVARGRALVALVARGRARVPSGFATRFNRQETQPRTQQPQSKKPSHIIKIA